MCKAPLKPIPEEAREKETDNVAGLDSKRCHGSQDTFRRTHGAPVNTVYRRGARVSRLKFALESEVTRVHRTIPFREEVTPRRKGQIVQRRRIERIAPKKCNVIVRMSLVLLVSDYGK